MEKYEVIKFKDNEFEMDVNVSPNEETVWLTLNEICHLFDRDKSVISRHINNVLKEEIIDVNRSVAKNATVQIEGNRQIVRYLDYYNLDVIISVGYRVKSNRGILFRKWANQVLKQYLLNGYVINENRTLVTNENYIRLINKVESLDDRVATIEKQYKPEEYINSKILFNGQFYDAYTLIQSIFEKANKEIIIIDNYVDRTILDRLVNKVRDARVTIYTHKDKSKLLNKDIEMFNKQYGNLIIKYTDKIHDRYIIIDQKILYHLGASIKDLGKKIFSISELEQKLIKILVLNL